MLRMSLRLKVDVEKIKSSKRIVTSVSAFNKTEYTNTTEA